MALAENVWDVIVVGAGLAGLKAALELKAQGKSVLVLEARDRVGGRCMAGEIAGQTIDLGGQWVGPQQKLLLAQAKALGVSTYPQYTKGASLLSRNGKMSSYTSKIPKLPWLCLLELLLIERRLAKDMATLPDDAPWLAPKAQEWDAESIESWALKHVRHSASRDFLHTLTNALLCADTAQISYLFFLDCLKRGHGLQVMMDVEGGAQQDKFRGGAWQIPKLMAEQLGDSIILNAPVLAVEQSPDEVHVVSALGNFKARYLIIATPPALASVIRFNPALPLKRARLLQNMPMGAVIKVHAAYPTAFWRKQGLNGAVASTDRHLSVVFDQSPEDESMGVLVGLIEGSHALDMSAAGPAARRKQVIEDLVHFFGDDAAQPVDYIDQDWQAEEWSQGGYAAHMPTGIMTTLGHVIRQPYGRIHWAGTETATEWMGYLDGALQSGIRAAKEVIELL